MLQNHYFAKAEGEEELKYEYVFGNHIDHSSGVHSWRLSEELIIGASFALEVAARGGAHLW